MIVVMPNGRAQPNDRAEGDIYAAAPAFAKFERDLLDDVIPAIESRYPVQPDREHRALAGLSMGGGQALILDWGNLDTFAWVGAFSPAPSTKPPADLVANPAEAAWQLRLLYLSCGNKDGLIRISQATHAYWEEKSLPHIWNVDGNAHDTWLEFNRPPAFKLELSRSVSRSVSAHRTRATDILAPMVRRLALCFIFSLSAAFAQVETVGDVSFALPDGWTYKPDGGAGTLIKTAGTNYWAMVVYPSMPSSGDPDNDVKTAWQRLILTSRDYQGMPPPPFYAIRGSVGYPGVRAEDTTVNRSAITRMYVLETGRGFVPVAVISQNRQVLDSMEHIALAFLGSIRQAPRKAQPVMTSIRISDLVGQWNSGAATSTDRYDPQTGRYQSNSTSFYSSSYKISADGSFTFQLGGMSNGSIVREKDSGVVELGNGYVSFKSKQKTARYSFIAFQHGLDDSAVLTLLGAQNQVTASNIILYAEHFTRVAK